MTPPIGVWESDFSLGSPWCFPLCLTPPGLYCFWIWGILCYWAALGLFIPNLSMSNGLWPSVLSFWAPVGRPEKLGLRADRMELRNEPRMTSLNCFLGGVPVYSGGVTDCAASCYKAVSLALRASYRFYLSFLLSWEMASSFCWMWPTFLWSISACDPAAIAFWTSFFFSVFCLFTSSRKYVLLESSSASLKVSVTCWMRFDYSSIFMFTYSSSCAVWNFAKLSSFTSREWKSFKAATVLDKSASSYWIRAVFCWFIYLSTVNFDSIMSNEDWLSAPPFCFNSSVWFCKSTIVALWS